MLPPLSRVISAVSYTHLDVYKRQEYGLGIRSEYGRYTLVEVTIPITL